MTTERTVTIEERLDGIVQLLVARNGEAQAALTYLESYDQAGIEQTEAFRAYAIARKLELKLRIDAVRERIAAIVRVMNGDTSAVAAVDRATGHVVNLDDFR